ncbi:MAG TPA: hypothetical protein VFS51_00135 [Gemmatimonadales bacterium]|nr:hypothetical protein [Gemmatimonadales bacterium]
MSTARVGDPAGEALPLGTQELRHWLARPWVAFDRSVHEHRRADERPIRRTRALPLEWSRLAPPHKSTDLVGFLDALPITGSGQARRGGARR